jgi:hypothetical protein
MPPRWLSILIVAVWLLFSARLVVRDLLPRLLPGQPPPYSIDLVEEVRNGRGHVDWMVLHDGKEVFESRSSILHPERDRDEYELKAEFRPLKPGERVALHGMLVRSLASTYRVTGAGDLLGVSVRVVGTPQLAQAIRLLGDTDFDISIDGTVKDNRLEPRVRLGLGGKDVREFALPGVAVRRGGSVLLPLHPVNRIAGLSPGQKWQMTVLDPLGDSLAALKGGGGELRILRAHVRDEPAEFVAPVTKTGRRRNPVLCLVIDYEGDDFTASTWVERERGLVMCQEATIGGDRWLMFRE